MFGKQRKQHEGKEYIIHFEVVSCLYISLFLIIWMMMVIIDDAGHMDDDAKNAF